MLKRSLASCSLMALLAIASLPAQAQAQTPAPNPAPAASQEKISPEELKKFSNAVKQILLIARETDNRMAEAVQKIGLTPARFNEIYLAKKEPPTPPANPVTPQEEQNYNQVLGQLSQIQKDSQARMDKAVETEGIAIDRFNQIFAVVQKNPQLRQEVQKMIQTP